MNLKSCLRFVGPSLLAVFAVGAIALADGDDWVLMAEKSDPANPSTVLCTVNCPGTGFQIVGSCEGGKNCCGFYKCSTGQMTNVECCSSGLACELYYFLGVPSARCSLQP